jgi:hypothetical protein
MEYAELCASSMMVCRKSPSSGTHVHVEGRGKEGREKGKEGKKRKREKKIGKRKIGKENRKRKEKEGGKGFRKLGEILRKLGGRRKGDLARFSGFGR